MGSADGGINGPEDPGGVAVFFEADHTLIVLSGTIDLVVADDLEHAGRDAIDRGLPIVVAAGDVEMIDSVGIAFLVRLAGAGAEAGWGVGFSSITPSTLELLELVGALDLFVRPVSLDSSGGAADRPAGRTDG
ncbi:MAG TPA: STAS domain-containing protein [Mycobacteriales bacterium]|jgi:anti-anti-sigma regulatory factor